jgi:Domain of unknown function (DUF5658)
MTHSACRRPMPIGIVSRMKPSDRPNVSNNWVATQLQGTELQATQPQGAQLLGSALQEIALQGTQLQKTSQEGTARQGTAPQGKTPTAARERRDRADRRRRVWWSVVYGSFNPRRRRPRRLLDDSRFHSLDWHAAHLLAVAMGILFLSVADAFMTVTLLSGGAVEMNPIMAVVVSKNAALFAGLKMAMTGLGVTLMVFLARYRFMRVVRVEVVLYAVLGAYVGLLGYEFWMLRQLIDIPGL